MNNTYLIVFNGQNAVNEVGLRGVLPNAQMINPYVWATHAQDATILETRIRGRGIFCHSGRSGRRHHGSPDRRADLVLATEGSVRDVSSKIITPERWGRWANAHRPFYCTVNFERRVCMDTYQKEIEMALERIRIDMRFVAENDPDGILKVMHAYTQWAKQDAPRVLPAQVAH
jgi:hypothetical protein